MLACLKQKEHERETVISIKITNYGLHEFECHLELEVVLEDFTDSIYFSKNPKGIFILEFTAKVQNLRKRNFK